MEKKLDNFTIVIFGGTGDLSTRKLLPSIYKLAKVNQLSCNYRIIGIGSRKIDDVTYRNYVKEKFETLNPGLIEDDQHFDQFSSNISYLDIDFKVCDRCERLKEKISNTENRDGVCDNILYYLAVPPSLILLIINYLNSAGLGGKKCQCPGWKRVVVEKPFGTDLKSAQLLNQELEKAFNEDQIYRIDHYLAKETVENIDFFRFANVIFESIWNRNYIDHVQITIAEDFGVRHRGKYYEESGLIRDIVQNHGLQMLATVASEPTILTDPEFSRNEKVKVFKSIRKMKGEELNTSIITGQYNGYKEEKGVSKDSTVETFAAIKFYIDNYRWMGVPFYLRAGKNLNQSLTEIVVSFKHYPVDIFGAGVSNNSNHIVFQIQPEEKISLNFLVKKPGAEKVVQETFMEFDYNKSFYRLGLDPYHKLFLDVIEGDQTRFIRVDAVEECWNLIDNIRSSSKMQASPILYEPGTWGPKEAQELIEKDGFNWRV